MNVHEAIEEVGHEAIFARTQFAKFNSCHEGLAVILEEFEEMKAEVFKHHSTRNTELLRNEARQLGAMAVRFMVDLT